ncbi:MAG: MucR family transcriptional regulator [Pseudomonadota bacterium]
MVKDTRQSKSDKSTIYGAVDILSAYVANNSVPLHDLPELIRVVHATLNGLSVDPATVGIKTPAVPIKRSITEDYLICLEDGKKFKTLKRHLRSKYDMTPDQYREKWGLPPDYPMVAPSYAEKRSSLAKEIGLGRSRKAK